jgi:hypothetical protein
LSFATPSIIASDLTAYHRLGLRSISCLTFGAFSVLAYPVNLLTFARCAHDLNTSPQATLGKAASERHPACKTEMAAAYQAVAKASASVLSYGDVMRPFMRAERIANKQIELGRAIEQFTQAIAAADRIRGSVREPLSVAEKKLWAYSSDTLTGLRSYLSARWKTGGQALEEGRRAIVKIRAALEHVREIAPEVKGNWGAYDLEWIHELWLSGLDEKLKNSANETLQEKPD